MSDNQVKSILFAGVGGQGILRASDIICEVIMEAGLDVKKSEVHGMAQRGGCVTSHVCYGPKVYSPLAEPGSIQTLVSFEKMESLRYLRFLKKDASIIVNTEEIYPPSVNMGDAPYPENAEKFLRNHYKMVISLNAAQLAQKAGNIRTANVVLLGALSKLMNIDTSIWKNVIKKSFPEKLVKMNLAAFQMGIDA
jgi:indolepyruvate ferredoxin oxidoreductase, beta subunit